MTQLYELCLIKCDVFKTNLKRKFLSFSRITDLQLSNVSCNVAVSHGSFFIYAPAKRICMSLTFSL